MVMTAEVKVREGVPAEKITLEQYGAMIGLPIKVHPFWGSARLPAYRVHKDCGGRVSPDRTVTYLRRPYWCFRCEKNVQDKDTRIESRKHIWICPVRKKLPEVQNNVIVLWEGPCGYRAPGGYGANYGHHTHAQTIEVKNVAHQAMLIAVRLSGISTALLLGMDGETPYAVRVPTRLESVQQALGWLMPLIVRKAIDQGLDVKRQGDWYFIPRGKAPLHSNYHSSVYGSLSRMETNRLYRGAALVFNGTQTRHQASVVTYQESLAGTNGPIPVVKGKIIAPNHPGLELEDWHNAVRNRSHPWRNEDRRDRRYAD